MTALSLQGVDRADQLLLYRNERGLRNHSADGPSSLGPWCERVTVTNMAFPTLELPIAPNQARTNQGTRRIVLRQFDDHAAVKIAEIADNVSTKFTDNVL